MRSLGLTWWLTGLPAAGKTTLARALASQLQQRGEPTYVLDGDELRRGLCQDLGFSDADRTENIRRAAEMARLLNHSGIHVIAALVSPLAQARQNARRIIGSNRFIEVYVSTPLSVCQHRDPKGLYALARTTPDLKLTGLSAPYQAPVTPDCEIDTQHTSLEEAVSQLLLTATQFMEPYDGGCRS